MSTTAIPEITKTALDDFKVLIICRGPIAMEAMEVAAQMGMPKPDIVVSKREVFETAESRAPWSEHKDLYDKLHIIDDYKDQDAIIEIAKHNAIDAIYVGYGYSAENSEFVRRVEETADLIPITTPSSVMSFSGSKFRAKKLVGEKLGIPVLPGSDRAAALATQDGTTDAQLLSTVVEETEAIWAKSPGQIIRLKAVSSGGGKGQRLVTEVPGVQAAVKEIWAEVGAVGKDGDKGILVEANLAHPRHWEIQVISDGETVVHFGGRECSIQNAGSQKFVEISLHPGQYDHYLEELDAEKDAAVIALLHEEQDRIRKTCDRAVQIIGSLGYCGAATVEFLVAEDGGPEVLGEPHFMEINSRIQVEHRVSEAISKVRGREVRLVGEQYRIGAGQKLGYTQDDITFSGYAFEARINASNPSFLIGASGSEIETYKIPPTSDRFFYDDGGTALLFDQGRRRRWAVPNFDSNFGLAVFRGPTQKAALEHARDLITEFDIKGNPQLKTTRSFHLGVLSMLLNSAPYGKIRTDFSEIFLAFGAKVYHALAKLQASAIDPGDPLRRLQLRALRAFQAEPALAIDFAFREKELREAAQSENGDLRGHLMTELAALIRCNLYAEELAAIQNLDGDYSAIIRQILDAVASSDVLDFRRNSGDLELNIPESVSKPRERRLLIDELRDATIDSIVPRPMPQREVDDLKGILSDLDSACAEKIDNADLLDRAQKGIRACRVPLDANASLSPTELREFYSDLRDLKWVIRKGNLPDEKENALLFDINRAVRVVRGPNVVVHLAGTIYLRPSPDKPNYINVGDEVIEDETVVALLENMKMFNEIRAHMSGKVKEILVENERPVLPGQVILVIE